MTGSRKILEMGCRIVVETGSPSSRFQGKFVLKEGNEEVLKILKEVGVLVHFSEYKHKYPYDWRTKVKGRVKGLGRGEKSGRQEEGDVCTYVNFPNLETRDHSRHLAMVRGTDWNPGSGHFGVKTKCRVHAFIWAFQTIRDGEHPR
jgi:hypothetical protein